MRWRIAWAGPWNIRSAIARFGVDVIDALIADGHEVEVLRTERDQSRDIPLIESTIPVRDLADTPSELRRLRYDVVIANLGDHFGYHGALEPLLKATEAVVIFHDAFLANYCYGWANRFPDPEAVANLLVRSTYGAVALPLDAPYWANLEEMMRTRPMLELFARHAIGAVVHGGHYQDRVAEACPGPVAQIALTYSDAKVSALRPAEGELAIATIGNVNPNKQVEAVIAAIGSSNRLRQACTYHVIGEIEPAERSRLEAVMQSHGVQRVHFIGYVNDIMLRELLAGMDVISCLRNPILEGGSASAIVAMLSGRAVLVSDHGVYAEIPDNIVYKCRPNHEGTDVARHLERMLGDRKDMVQRGAGARAYALQTHGAARYARELIKLAEQAVEQAPRARTGAAFGQILASFGLGADDPAIGPVAEAIAALLV